MSNPFSGADGPKIVVGNQRLVVDPVSGVVKVEIGGPPGPKGSLKDTTHGNLSGLDADDHPHYMTTERADPKYRDLKTVWDLVGGMDWDLSVTRDEIADENVLENEWNFDYFLDGDALGFLRGQDGVLRSYGLCDPDGGIGISTVKDRDPLAAPRRVATLQNYPEPTAPATLDGSIDRHWASGGPVVDLGNGVGFMFVHIEDYYGGGDFGLDDWAYWMTGAAKVVDLGGEDQTITFLGPLIEHTVSPQDAYDGDWKFHMHGGHFVEWEGYIYYYHVDFTQGPNQFHHTVSRCLKSDIAAAVAADTVPQFKKYGGGGIDGTWDADSNGRVASVALTGSANDVATMGDTVHLPDGRLLYAGCLSKSSMQWQFDACVGTDPLTWGPLIPLMAEQGDEEWIYTTVWSGDEQSPKHVTKNDVQVFFTNNESADPALRWDIHSVDRLTLSPRLTGEPSFPSTMFEMLLSPAYLPPYPGDPYSIPNVIPESDSSVNVYLLYGPQEVWLPDVRNLRPGTIYWFVCANNPAAPPEFVYRLVPFADPRPPDTPVESQRLGGVEFLVEFNGGAIFPLVAAYGTGGWLNVAPSAAGIQVVIDALNNNVQSVLQDHENRITALEP